MYDFMDTSYSEDNFVIDPNQPYIPEAADCMRCGMCVSNCPTFRLFQIEEESPRRRIRTISKLLLEDRQPDQQERQHLDSCLQCRACEVVCPSRMAYGQLFDQARIKLQPQHNYLAKFGFRLIENKTLRTALTPLIKLYQKIGLQKLLRQTGLLKKLHLSEAEALLNQPLQNPLSANYPPKIAQRGKVALFTGCLAEQFDGDTLTAAIKVFNAIGYAVEVPPQQTCCGAIHQHNGLSAQQFITTNLAVFTALQVDAIVFAASGCGAMLSEYQSQNAQHLAQFQQGLHDINEFLLKNWPEDLFLKPVSQTVAVHEPCSQRNVLKNSQAIYDLLKKITDLNVMALEDNQICCGAGGSYMLSHSQNAADLRKLKLKAISIAQADEVVSSNFGCSIFLNAAGAKLRHPLVLLARQLPD